MMMMQESSDEGGDAGKKHYEPKTIFINHKINQDGIYEDHASIREGNKEANIVIKIEKNDINIIESILISLGISLKK